MVSHTELHELLDGYPALRGLPPRLHQALQRDAQRLNASAGQVLFDVGSPCHIFNMLTSGSIRVIKPGSGGREILLFRLQPGESCTLTVSCLLRRSTYPARGVVEADLSGLSISRALFMELVEQSPTFRTSVFHLFAERVTSLIELIEEVAFQRMDQRLAALLLTKGVSIKTTHQTLADELGTVREIVSRILEDFEGQGILSLKRRQIRIQDNAALEKIARPP